MFILGRGDDPEMNVKMKIDDEIKSSDNQVIA